MRNSAVDGMARDTDKNHTTHYWEEMSGRLPMPSLAFYARVETR
jgi:hypothetical protein